jgi:hypothetical protein
MAKAFTTSFSFSGKLHTAVIYQSEGCMIIYLPDESLHTILPDGKFSFNPEKGLKIDTPRLTPAQNLVLKVLTAMEMDNSSLKKWMGNYKS